MSDVEFNTREFSRALQQVVLYSKHDAAFEVNKAALNVVIKAQKLTPKADPAKIEKALVSRTTSFATSRSGNALKKPRAFKYPAAVVFKIIAKKTGLPGLSHAAMGLAARRFISKAKSGSGFTSIGYQQACLAFGGRGFGKVRESYYKTQARAGYGLRAAESVREVIARFSNTSPWILHIGISALNQAMALASSDLMKHLEFMMKRRFEQAH